MVTVRMLVESCSEAEVQVEFDQWGDVVPMGSALSMVVPAVPVMVGREVNMVWFQLRVLEMLPGLFPVKAVDVGKPCVHGASGVEVILSQGPWLLWLLSGRPETPETPDAEKYAV